MSYVCGRKRLSLTFVYCNQDKPVLSTFESSFTLFIEHSVISYLYKTHRPNILEVLKHLLLHSVRDVMVREDGNHRLF